MSHLLYILRYLLALSFSLGVLSSSSLSFALSAQASVDRNEVQLGEQINLTVSVDLSSGRAEPPSLPNLPAFEIHSMGTSTSFNFVNGRQSIQYRYQYVLIPQQLGTFTIGAITVLGDNHTIKTKPISVTVKRTRAIPKQAKAGQDLFITCRITNNKPYVGEQIVYTVKFYRRLQIADANYTPPQFTDIATEPLGEQKSYETTFQGKQYIVTELKTALIPQQSGTLTIPAPTIKATVLVRNNRRRGGFFDDFFGMPSQQKSVTISGNAVSLEVKELPSKGRPQKFANLVGHFSLKYELSKKVVAAKESTTLTLTLHGSGNILSMALPAPPEDENFKVYEDKPIFNKSSQGNTLQGTSIAKWAIVPLNPGEIVIPGISLAYFNPDTQQYEYTRIPSQKIRVLPAKADEDFKLTKFAGTQTAQKAVELLGKDIMPLHRSIGLISPPLTVITKTQWFLLFTILPLILYLGIYYQRKQNQKTPQQLKALQASKALAKAQKELSKLHKQEDTHTYGMLGSVMRTYFSEKLQLSGKAITAKDIPSLLTEKNVNQEHIQKITELFTIIERGIYAPDPSPSMKITSLLPALRSALKEVDRAL